MYLLYIIKYHEIKSFQLKTNIPTPLTTCNVIHDDATQTLTHIVNYEYMNKLGGCTHKIYNMATCNLHPSSKFKSFNMIKVIS